MLIRTGMGTQLSGSVGGVVASRNSGGMYLRNRSVPVNPNSDAQQTTRTAFGNSSIGWNGLTGAQRTAWNAYAASTPVVNRLGETINLSGFNWYTAVNSLRTGSGATVQAAAPATPGLSALGAADVSVLSAANGITLVASGLAVDGAYVVSLSPPLSPGVTFFGGPYSRYLIGQDFDGDAGANAVNVSPLRYGAILSGQRRAFRLACSSDTDGKLTPILTGFITAGA